MDFDKVKSAYDAYVQLQTLKDDTSDDRVEKIFTAIQSINLKEINNRYINDIIDILKLAVSEIYENSLKSANNTLGYNLHRVNEVKCCDDLDNLHRSEENS